MTRDPGLQPTEGERLRVAVLTPYDHQTASTRQRIYKNVALFPDRVSVKIFSSAPRTRSGGPTWMPSRGMDLLGELLAKLRHLWAARRYDVVVVQKGLTLFNLRGLPRLLGRWCPRLVFDFDDAVYLGSPLTFRRPLLRRLSDPRQALELMERARVVVAGNRFLAEVAGRHCKQVRVVPTAMDTDWYRVKPVQTEGSVTLGWSGSSSTNHYLAALAPVIARLATRMPEMNFHVISNDERDLERRAFAPARVGFTRFSLDSLVEDLHRFDVGVMPLDDDEWSRSKCGGKILQYMACGIPPVCSPVGINSEVIQDGVNGFLVRSESEWEDRLGRLLSDPGLRGRLGAQARKTVEERYANRVAAPQLLAAIEAAADV